MSIRPQVQRLVNLGPCPASQDLDEQDIERRGALIDAITPPVSREEALALLSSFGPDEAFGIAWDLVHLIETTPDGLPLTEKPDESENEWVRYLWERSHRT